ncbi:hypothetical protein [Paracoccus sp. S-4012]|uniref:hypothetical protein n=1 Tax=Paracoccus sp. S-4012 TaxID=2665648 RepID=UPI0018A1DA62|nr:hypothetical protein [Paracoccus sp. S-4012]
MLWPNGRPPHWSARHRAAQKQRAEAGILARSAGLRHLPEGARVTLTFAFQPSFRTITFDLDNAVASQKAAIDGIVEVLGVDDSRFGYGAPTALPRARGTAGAAILTITFPSREDAP